MEKSIISSYTVEKRANKACKKILKQSRKDIRSNALSSASLELYLPQVDAKFHAIIADISTAINNTRSRKERQRAETYTKVGGDIRSLRPDIDQMNQAHLDVVRKAKKLGINDDSINYQPVDIKDLETRYAKLSKDNQKGVK